MKTKIERATEIHRSMTPHQMALRIVELQDALELADEAVRAKHFPDAAKMVAHEGWQLVPVEPTPEMSQAGVADQAEKLKRYALGGSLPPIDHGIPDAYRAMLAAAPKPKPVADASYIDGDPK